MYGQIDTNSTIPWLQYYINLFSSLPPPRYFLIFHVTLWWINFGATIQYCSKYAKKYSKIFFLIHLKFNAN